jgi:5'-methylthioadenosine phosphorylase
MVVKIGIIGGSGLDNPELFMNPKDVAASTQWGDPSSLLKIGKMKGANHIFYL